MAAPGLELNLQKAGVLGRVGRWAVIAYKRDRGVFSGVIFMRVFGANDLQPFRYQSAPIRHGCRPGRRESAGVLDGKVELERAGKLLPRPFDSSSF